MKKVSLLLVTIFILIGCGEIDKKEVSKENFKRVLNDYYSRNCVEMYAAKFPKEIKLEKSNEDALKELEALEKIGLLSSEKVKIEDGYGNRKKLVDGKKFTLTEKGNKFYQKGERSFSNFCVGKHTIATIDNYTKPSDMFGVTLSTVNYTFEPLKSEILTEMLKEEVLAKKLKHSVEKKSDKSHLILTEVKGWMHKKDFEKSK